MTRKTVTARQIIRMYGLAVDEVYKTINRYGMDPGHLTTQNIEMIRNEKDKPKRETSEKTGLENVVDVSDALKDRAILELSLDLGDRVVSYFVYAKDFRDVDFERDYVPYEDFLRNVEADIDNLPQKKKPKKNDTIGEGSKGGKGRKGAAKRKPHEIRMDERLARDLLDDKERSMLRALYYGDPKQEPVDFSQTSLLTKTLGADVREQLERNGYQLKLYSPEALMKKARDAKRHRLETEISAYFSKGGGAFLDSKTDRFKADWQDDDDIKDLISWLERNGKQEVREHGTPFFINAVRVKFGDHFKRSIPSEKRIHTLFQAWLMGASHYECVRSHPYTKHFVTSKETYSLEDIGVKLVEEFAGKKSYRQGDARRFYGGLFAAGKLEESGVRVDEGINSVFQRAERYGNEIDYLLMRFDEIGEIAKGILERVKKGKIQEDASRANQKLYEQIKDGEYAPTDSESVRHLSRALRKQMDDSEIQKFYNRNDTNKTRAESGIGCILYHYLMQEKDNLFGKK